MTLRFRLSWFFLFFFFSSRRRHTRCSRDWSSDVCSSDLVTRPLTLAGPGLVSSRSARVSGASWARTVATAPERGGATTSSSYTPATASSARTTNRAVPTWDPPIGTIESRASSRNGAPLGSYRMALAVCCPESASVTVATRVAPAGATRRKYRRTWPGPTGRRSSNNGLSGRLRSEEHTSELQSRLHLVCRLLLEKKKNQNTHRA